MEKMNISHTDTHVLLIGRGLRQIDRMIETLNLVGAELFFAEDATEGLRLMSLEPPDLVVCHVDLPDADAADLCSAIRSSSRLKRIPIVFAGESKSGVDGVFKALNAGADDFISQHFDPDAFLAKLVWMMEQRSDENAQRERYESLRRSQIQTLEIVRETAAMFRTMNVDGVAGCEDAAHFEERIEMGLGMIAGLTNVLEEQIKAADSWFGTGVDIVAPIVDFVLRDSLEIKLEAQELLLAA
jgi:PleD family two-component response regulator